MPDPNATIQFPSSISSQGLVRIEGTPAADVHALAEKRYHIPTPKQITVLDDIMLHGFDIIVYPDGSVQLDR